MNGWIRLLGALALSTACATGASAQEAGAAVDNGTDPTRLNRTVTLSYEHLELLGGADIGTASLRYSLPVTPDKRTAVQIKVPFVTASFDTGSGLGLGDASLRLTRVFDVTREYGIVGQAELIFDTAERRALGNGTEVLKLTGIYARFLPNGGILAPAIVHSERIGAPAAGGGDISNTVFDLYYVPRLEDPRWYMTLDPAIGYDWTTDRASGSLAVTIGRNIETAGRGTASIFVKPSLGIGEHRLFDAGLEVGFKVVGF